MERVRKAIFPIVLVCSAILSSLALGARSGSARADTARPPQEPGTAARGVVSAGQEGCAWSARYPQSVARWCALIQGAARESGLSGSLIAALMLEESGGDPLAVSKDGAVGLLQVMPRDGVASNFNCPGGPCFAHRPTTAELQDPVTNVRYGARYLSSLVQRQGSTREALKSYGPTGVGYAYADAVLAIQSRSQASAPSR